MDETANYLELLCHVVRICCRALVRSFQIFGNECTRTKITVKFRSVVNLNRAAYGAVMHEVNRMWALKDSTCAALFKRL